MVKEKLENVECKVCKNCKPEKFHIKFSKNNVDFIQCEQCEFIFIPPHFRESIDYASYKDEGVLNAVIKGNDWLKVQRHLLRYKTIKKFKPSGKLFDLGSGWGHFMLTGNQLGYETEGIEIAKMPFTYAKDYLKLNVEEKDFFVYEPKTNNYDIVTMWDVLEHIDNCDQVVDKCYTMLKEDGYLILQVPQIDSFIAKRMKEKWTEIGLDHVNYFTRKTITKLLEDRNFKVVKIKSSIEVKHLLMNFVYNKQKSKSNQSTTISVSADRQEYYNKAVNKPKWQLKLMVFIHNIIYNLLSTFRIGEEIFVIAKKR